MLDLLHLPKSTPSNVDYFYNTGGTSWVTWEKPRGIIMLEMICIGAGSAGRSGAFTGITRTGGGGGSSGGFTRLLIPAVFLPDVLYVQVGKGGAAGVVTGSGTASYVSIAPSTAAIYVACFANGGTGGTGGTSSSSPGGSAAAVALQSSALMSGLGQFFALAGQAGASGNSSAGQSITYPTTGLLLSGGASGCGASGGASTGGSIFMPTQSSFSLIPTRVGYLITTTSQQGAHGDDGMTLLQPLMSTGGAGGSAANDGSNTGYGGRGGHGGLGSGGGGGGAGGRSFGAGGVGGNGGDGLVIIRSW